MPSLLHRLGRFAARAGWRALVGWVVVLGLAALGAAAFSHGTDDRFTVPGTQSQRALDSLDRLFPQVSGTSAQIVVVAPGGAGVRTPVIRQAVAEAAADSMHVPQVLTAIDPFTKAYGVSADGRAAVITLQLRVHTTEVTSATRDQLTGIGAQLQRQVGDAAKVHVGGNAMDDVVPRLSTTEMVGVVIALGVLLIGFRSFLAAGTPLLSAALGVTLAASLVYLATRLTAISSTALMLAVMLGLAVGIDYALLLLSRHRDQLAAGMDVRESIGQATATAGSAVVFAGSTVVIALLGLSVAGIPFLTKIGVAAAVGVASAVLVAVTMLPALLAVAGERLRPAPRRAGRHERRLRSEQMASRLCMPERSEGMSRRSGLAVRWVRLVTRVPAATIALVVVLLGVCALPARHLQLALPDVSSNPKSSQVRQTYDAISAHFGTGYSSPLLLSIDVRPTADPAGVTQRIAAEVAQVPGVAAVPLATPNATGDAAVVEVVPATASDDAATAGLVHRLRAMNQHFVREYGVQTAVTGNTAVAIDVSDRLSAALLPFAAVVVGLSLLLLAFVFRSVWVPIKATAGYLLSVGAAFGITSFVFGEGHFASALHVARVGSVVSFLPVVLMGVLFGLAMDYEVFLVSRIREDYSRHGDAGAAIESGFASAGRVVTSAALIMIAVFAAFVPSGTAIIKPIAFSLAVGVLIDAFLVRMTLVPAVLALLGDRAWRLPRRLTPRGSALNPCVSQSRGRRRGLRRPVPLPPRPAATRPEAAVRTPRR